MRFFFFLKLINMMKVKIRRLVVEAQIPKYSTSGAAGMDLTAVSKGYDFDGNIVYDTGLTFEIPEGYIGLIFPRSSIAKYMITLTNSVGVIDSDFRGSVKLKFKPAIPNLTELGDQEESPDDYNVGDRIGQLIILPYPKIEFEEVHELTVTGRGDLGYGSTGE
jgi:dUTP pyrophosphatase